MTTFIVDCRTVIIDSSIVIVDGYTVINGWTAEVLIVKLISSLIMSLSLLNH